MSRNINKIFITIVAVALFLPLGYRVCDVLIPDIEENSDLEGRTYQTMPELSAKTISSGSFQDDMEQMVADSVPGRKGALVINAAFQRAFIQVANLPFGFEVYPTFYGSNYAYDPSLAAVMQIPETQDEAEDDAVQSIQAAANMVEARPEINWAFYLPQRSNVSNVSPVHDLMNDVADYSYYEELLRATLPEGCQVLEDEYSSIEEYYQNYFRTDHHWQIEGAVRAYDRICAAFGKKATTLDKFFTAYEGAFYGSNARAGLEIDVSDTVDDVEYDASSLQVWIDGEKKDISSLDEGYSDKKFEKRSTFDTVYASYFHGNHGLITIKNPEVSGGTLLIIGDSYTHCNDRLFAANYQTVYVLDPRVYEGSMDEFLSEHEIDDAVFITCTTTLNNDLTQECFAG